MADALRALAVGLDVAAIVIVGYVSAHAIRYPTSKYPHARLHVVLVTLASWAALVSFALLSIERIGHRFNWLITPFNIAFAAILLAAMFELASERRIDEAPDPAHPSRRDPIPLSTKATWALMVGLSIYVLIATQETTSRELRDERRTCQVQGRGLVASHDLAWIVWRFVVPAAKNDPVASRIAKDYLKVTASQPVQRKCS